MKPAPEEVERVLCAAKLGAFSVTGSAASTNDSRSRAERTGNSATGRCEPGAR